MVYQRSISFFQKEGDGASPSIRSIDWRIAKEFLARWHYLGRKCPAGIKKIFALYDKEGLAGIAVFTNTRCREWDKKGNIWELARFALRDDCPKNSESQLLSKLFRLLRKDIDFILAYSDPEQKHKGIIYKATGFRFLGQTHSRDDTFYLDGERISARTLWDRYGTSSIPKLKEILGNRLRTRTRLGKLTFIRELKRNKKWIK